MLRSTFTCLRGIGEGAEQRLWRRGIQTWRELSLRRSECFSAHTAEGVGEELKFAESALGAGLADFFLSRLKGVSKARIFCDFRARIGYLDVETDGLGVKASVTTVALYREGALRVFVAGRDLHESIPALASCDVLATFNGSTFDLPILRRCLGINLGQAHIDIMHVLRAAGYSGGLKAIEQRLGLHRHLSEGMDGSDAVMLWQRYRRDADLESLRRLVTYNAEDALVLERLLIHAYNLSMSAFPVRVQFSQPAAEEHEMLLAQCSLTFE